MKKLYVIIAMVTLLFITVNVLSGCTSGLTPEQTVDKALNAIRLLDRETIDKYIDHVKGMEVDDENYNKVLFGGMTYKILESKKEGNTAIVKVAVTNRDLKTALAETFKQDLTEKMIAAFKPESEQMTGYDTNNRFDTIFKEQVGKLNGKTVTAEVDIKLQKKDNGWMITMDDVLADALLGGMYMQLQKVGEVIEALQQ